MWDVSTQLTARVVIRVTRLLPDFVDAEIVAQQWIGFQILGRSVSRDRAMIGVAAGFGYDLDDAAIRLSILRLKTAGLHLNFFNE